MNTGVLSSCIHSNYSELAGSSANAVDYTGPLFDTHMHYNVEAASGALRTQYRDTKL